MHQLERRWKPMLAVAFLAVTGPLWVANAEPFEIRASPLVPQPSRAEPPLPSYPLQLVVDDDQAESSFGINAATSLQFLWFNQFDNPGPFTLEEIWVLFPPGSNMSVGASVELVVFTDPDGDPTNGADLLASYAVTIQVLDGNTFSIYPVSLAITDPGDILIGVINRFTDPTATPPLTEPALVDTTNGQGSSWWALWNGEVPDPPALPPDLAMERLTGNTDGNWMIRGFGTALQIPAIPVLDWSGAAVLVSLLAVLGCYLLRRSGAQTGV